MNFTVYSKYGCPYCTKIIKFLSTLSETKGYSVKEYSLDSDFTKEQFYYEFGQGSTFPQVIFNGIHIGGCSDSVKYLRENNLI